MSKSIATHPRPFHADDLVACALMKAYWEAHGHEVRFIFSREPHEVASADSAVDTGGIHNESQLRFDHHQNSQSEHAATGLVADFLEKQDKFAWLRELRGEFDKIDKADLGKSHEHNRLSMLLGLFNPSWKELQECQLKTGTDIGAKYFAEAIEVVEHALHLAKVSPINKGGVFSEALTTHPIMLARQAEVSEAKTQGQQLFINAARSISGGIVYTKPGIEFSELFSRKYLENAETSVREAIDLVHYVAFPASPSPGWSAVAAPEADNPMRQKSPFPETWRGKRGRELLNAISLSTGRNYTFHQSQAANYFCHASGFFLTLPDQLPFREALDFCMQRVSQVSHENQPELDV